MKRILFLLSPLPINEASLILCASPPEILLEELYNFKPLLFSLFSSTLKQKAPEKSELK